MEFLLNTFGRRRTNMAQRTSLTNEDTVIEKAAAEKAAAEQAAAEE